MHHRGEIDHAIVNDENRGRGRGFTLAWSVTIGIGHVVYEGLPLNLLIRTIIIHQQQQNRVNNGSSSFQTVLQGI